MWVSETEDVSIVFGVLKTQRFGNWICFLLQAEVNRVRLNELMSTVSETFRQK
jgi:hypothetical protein